MKKEYVIFLILIICSAMICGSTLVITTNLSLLAGTAAQVEQIAQQEAGGETEKATQNNTTSVADADRLQAATLIVSSTDSTAVEEVMLITPAEQEQIQNMLASLSSNGQGDYTQLVKDFQIQHSLSPTGEMDTSTLNEIIRRVALMKTTEKLS